MKRKENKSNSIRREYLSLGMTHMEMTMYLKGARDILMRLQEDYEHYIIPYTYCKLKNPNIELHDTEHPFPITSSKVRKMMGEALIKTLIEDKRSLERFLLWKYNGIKATAVERNKKGQVTRVIISIE